MKEKKILISLIIFAGLILSACQPVIQPENPTGDVEYEYGERAAVESVEVVLLESFPVQAQVIVAGTLPDGCTELYDIVVERQGLRFNLTLTTRRMVGDIACTEALVPFEETVELDIYGLGPGTYTVVAQDKKVTFTLDVNNVISDKDQAAKFSYGNRATVESMLINSMESFPVQVSVTLEGYLPDGCTEIDEISASREGQTFTIDLVTRKPTDLACTQALVPFEETVDLDVSGLEAGTYTVIVQDQQETFTLDIDNVSQEGVGTKYSYGSSATIESMSVDIMESFPVQVSVTLSGYVPDGCTKIYEITSEREESTFTIDVLTRKPVDLACTMAIVPFEETISLDVEGLPAGEYTVKLGNMSETFTFEQDNEL